MVDADGGLLRSEAVHGGKHGFHQPKHLAAVHDILVDEELVLLIKRLCGLGDDDSVIFNVGGYFSVGVFTTFNKGVDFTGDLASRHVIVLLEGLGDVVNLGLSELAMSLDESDGRLLGTGYFDDGVEQTELKVLHRSVQGFFR